MASQVELRLTVPVDQARDIVGTALAEQGFTVQVAPNGSLDVSRGSLGTTVVAGALAGQDMHVRFDVDIEPSGNGSVARVRSSGVGGFLKGGAVGASKANDVVRNAAHQLGTQLAAQGVLEGSPAVDPGLAGVSPEFAAVGTPAGTGTSASTGTGTGTGMSAGTGIPAPVDYANRTNVVAIVALILGFLVPIGGIIAGAVALAQVKRTGEKGRGLAIAGIAVGSALTVLIVGGAIALFALGINAAVQEAESGAPLPSASSPADDDDPLPEDPESVDVFSLAVGDCINDAGLDEVTDVEVIDCAQPHDLEVFSEFTLEGDDFPGADEVDTLATDGCFQAFPAFVGLTYEESVLDYTYFVPTQESWETGDDRLVSCLIGEPDVQTAGTLAGAAR